MPVAPELASALLPVLLAELVEPLCVPLAVLEALAVAAAAVPPAASLATALAAPLEAAAEELFEDVPADVAVVPWDACKEAACPALLPLAVLPSALPSRSGPVRQGALLEALMALNRSSKNVCSALRTWARELLVELVALLAPVEEVLLPAAASALALAPAFASVALAVLPPLAEALLDEAVAEDGRPN